ncbi:MAG: hypothetical protein A2V50_00310 [Bacteroidetes bacterium RBG_19FT_COMBO_42_10]|nr:MAG: hypothetical protein A2V50_00310 [Bacteroidetes bacterium RBG_19FT_COMBO_42_10]
MKYMNFYKPESMKRKIIFFIVSLVLSPHLIKAQNPNQERLNAYKIAFFTNRLKLTPGEAEKFWPVYNEFQAKKLQIRQERVLLNRKFNQEAPAMSDEQLTAAGDKLIELQVLETEISVAFHNQLKGILPPEKVLRLYQAENQYRQQLLNELQQRRQQRDNPTRPGPLPERN